ncbi:trypsin-related protease [Fusarium albosuccineum]|uniref:Trypsin-related protease n=1 Tax=Fusarium albosuccineum TaxID=1237068 RepID=A0A8H4LBE9_9HYPO|nr:trypsin-related protease [Fusarium albosuccineum]
MSRNSEFGLGLSITDNDIAILHLAKPIEKSYTIGYATLPEQGSDPVAKSTATIAGWGDLEFGGLPAENLMKVSVPIVARQTCKKQYAKDNPPLNVTDNMFCAGLKKGGKDSCQGDSGGPIIDKETGVLIGVVSWGKQCALAGFPGVYTRIGNYIPFIAKNLAKP